MRHDDTYYEAMLARDNRFDGKFFVGVKTTGIYCRPICPAKPKRENVVFFRSHIEAERAGFRPCLRCRPESAPQSAAWIGSSAVVQRAVRNLNSVSDANFNEDEFAARFGVSARHLRRLFISEIGKSPKQLAIENRLNLARKLLVETSLTITDVAFAAGFNSIRRFNDAFKERFKKQPSEIRRSPLMGSDGLTISLSYRPPYDFGGLLSSYRAHRVGDLEWFEEGSMFRIIRIDDKVGRIKISNDADEYRILVEIVFPDLTQVPRIVAHVRAMFDLDSDPVLIANSLESDKKMKALLRLHPGVRLPSGWDPFEVAIATILGQLVSVERGRALVHDLIDLVGDPSGMERDGKPIKFFPTPKQLAHADLATLKTTRIRKETLVLFAKAICDGSITLDATQDVDTFVDNVMKIKGIGAWTAHYMALKALRHTDAFPATDLVLARALESHDQTAIDKMSPWRGYVAALLWRDYQ